MHETDTAIFCWLKISSDVSEEELALRKMIRFWTVELVASSLSCSNNRVCCSGACDFIILPKSICLLPPELFPFSLWNLCSWHFLSFFDVLVASHYFTMSSSSCPKPTSSPITYSGGIFFTGPQVIFPIAKGLPVERAASFVHYFSFLFPQGLSFSVEFFKYASSGWNFFLFFRRSVFVLIQPIISSTTSRFNGTPIPLLEVSIYSSSVLKCTRLQTY